MKKLLQFLVLPLLLLVFGSFEMYSQIAVTVTNPTNTTPNLSASYTSLATALTALNSTTAMTGSITLTLAAGSNETSTATGLFVGSATLNPVLSATNTITIVKATGAATVLNAAVGTSTPGSAAPDGIFSIRGADYVTIDGLTFTDGNTTNPATMEFGVALFKLNASDGANNNTIQNCIFNMQRVNNANSSAPMVEGSVGILVINATVTAATTALTPTNGGTLATNGTNSNNKFYSNTINSGNYGVALISFVATVGVGPAPIATTFLGDIGNDIGGTSLSTGNSILNYGGAAAATNPSAGIRTLAQYGLNVSYNTVNNNNGSGVNHANTLRGIYLNTATSASATVNNNSVTVSSGATASQLSGIENAAGATAALNTIAINNNTVVTNYSTATTGITYGIYNNSATPENLNSNNNSVTITTAATSFFSYAIYIAGLIKSTINMNSNTVSVTYTAATTAGSIRGLYCTGGATTCATSISSNTINTLAFTGTTGGSGSAYGIFNTGTPLTMVMSNNIFNNLSIKTTGTIYLMFNSYTAPANGSKTIQNNSITGSIARTAAGGAGVFYGYFDQGASPSSVSHTISGNNFSNVTTGATSTGTCYGIYSSDSAGTGTLPSLSLNAYNNTVSNWSTGTGSFLAIYLNGFGGTLGTPDQVYNNSVTGCNVLSTPPANQSQMLSIGSAGLYVNVYNNTVNAITQNAVTTPAQLSGCQLSGGTYTKFYNNTITNLTSATGGLLLGLGLQLGTKIDAYQNFINTFSTSGTIAGIITFSGIETNVFEHKVIGANNYSIYGLTSSGTTSLVQGILVTSTGALSRVYKNNIYNLSNTSASTTATTALVKGIVLSNGSTVNTYNNLVSNLTAPAVSYVDAIRGISVESATASTTFNVHNNTVLLSGTSSGTNFGTTGLYHTGSATATTSTLDLRNNIIVNISTPTGTGVATALRRSGAALLGNFSINSNRNSLYAGTPSATHTLMFDGTNAYQTMASYQTAVAPSREVNSFSEGTFNYAITTPGGFFSSITPTDATYLQPLSGITTQSESGGLSTGIFTDDYSGAVRPVSPGSSFDCGAWEFNGITPAPQVFLTSILPAAASQCVKANRVVTVTVTNTGAATTTGVVLNYNHNGTAQTPITMTNTSGNIWTGTMLAPTVGNATVTWNVVATNTNILTGTYVGTSFADEPLSAVVVTPSTATLCVGAIQSLVATGSANTMGATNNATLGAAVTLTTATSGTQPTAFCNRYAQYWNQTIYTAAELTASGLSAGSNISSITYTTTTQGDAANNTNFSIKIGNTASTVLTAFQTTGLTNVYGPSSFVHVIGANLISFSTNYVWDGLSNLIIDVRQDGIDSINNTITYFTAAADNKNISAFTSTPSSTTTIQSEVSSLVTAVNPSTARLNITLGYFNFNNAPVVWTPNGAGSGLYTDAGATVVYTGTDLRTVYAKPTTTSTYTATATGNGCTRTATSVLTVDQLAVGGAVTGTQTWCLGKKPTDLTVSGYTGTILKWQYDTTVGFALPTDIASTAITLPAALAQPAATTALYYRAVITNGSCPTVFSTPQLVQAVAGANLATYTAGAWNPSSPMASNTTIVFDDNYAPTVPVTLKGCDCTVNSGKTVTIPTGSTLELLNELNVDATSTMTFYNDAPLLQTNSTYPNVGKIIVNRNSSSLMRLDYTLWSSPVSSLLSLKNFSTNTVNNRFYTYTPLSNTYSTIDPTSNIFSIGKGYLIRMPDNHPTSPSIWSGQFNGIPVNGSISVPISDAGPVLTPLFQGFNVIGNPYPSQVNINQFLTANSANIESSLYFWRKTNESSPGPILFSGYCTYTGGILSQGSSFTNGIDPLGVLQIGQGFMVKAKAGQSSVTFNNGMRILDTANQFFKTTSTPEVKNTFWLNLMTSSGGYAQMASSYREVATMGVDINDGFNLNDGQLSVGSLIDNKNYIIQSRTLPFDVTDVMPLVFKTNVDGNYTFAIDHVDGLFTAGAQPIYLRDTVLNTVTNLNTGNYTFATTAGTVDNRFEIIYQNVLATPTNTLNENALVVYKNSGDIVVNSGNVIMSNVKIFDMRGRLLLDKNNINGTEVRLNIGATNQVVLVKTTLAEGQVITKKVIN